MNVRNILWLAPLPSNSTKEWVAPGVYSHFICIYCYTLYIILVIHLSELNLLFLLAKSFRLWRIASATFAIL